MHPTLHWAVFKPSNKRHTDLMNPTMHRAVISPSQQKITALLPPTLHSRVISPSRPSHTSQLPPTPHRAGLNTSQQRITALLPDWKVLEIEGIIHVDKVRLSKYILIKVGARRPRGKPTLNNCTRISMSLKSCPTKTKADII